MEIFNTVIIGGGASGLFLANQLQNCLVIEANDRVGKKLLATGNGKCNLLNKNLDYKKYNHPQFVKSIFEKYDVEEILNLFFRLGLLTKEIDGRIYPYSESANTVLDILRKNLKNVILNAMAQKIEKLNDIFCISLLDNKKVYAKNVVLSTGSAAGFGKDSLNLLLNFGHKKTCIKPSLCPILTDRESVKGLNGIRVKAKLHYGEDFEVGEILFKDYGLSGIAAFNISSHIARGGKGELYIDFMPDYTQDEVAKLFSGKDSLTTLKGIFHSKIAMRLFERGDILNSIKHYTVKYNGLSDMSMAQVACGGISIDEVDENLESKKIKGLYITGEALDIDGLCGGYNLGWCWASALAVANKINGEKNERY